MRQRRALVLRPHEDGALSAYMDWITVTHVRRWHAHYGTEPDPSARADSSHFQFKKTIIFCPCAVTWSATPCRRTWWRGRKNGPGRACGIGSMAPGRTGWSSGPCPLRPARQPTSIGPRPGRNLQPCAAVSCAAFHSKTNSGNDEPLWHWGWSPRCARVAGPRRNAKKNLTPLFFHPLIVRYVKESSACFEVQQHCCGHL